MVQQRGERRPGRAAALILCLSVAAAIGGTGTARADAGPDPDKRAAARAKLVEGDHLLKGGEFQKALAAFKEAFELFPSPKIHYNFALALQGMGRNADALEAFDAFLNGAADAQPEAREHARASRENLLQRVGMLRVSTEGAGAQVVVDGRDVGRTPLPRAIPLDVGPHLLLVERGDGSPPYTKRFQVTGGGTVDVHLGAEDLARARVPNDAGEPAKPADVTTGAPATASVVPTGGRSSTDSGRRWRMAGLVTASGGALLIGGGALFGLAARSASQDVSRQFDADRDSAGKRAEVLQWLGYGLGAAAVITGALLYVHGGHVDADESTGPALHALVTPRGVLLEGRF